MTATDRRIKIFNIIAQEKSVKVNNLSELFDVTPMTIRRDLSILENQGILTTNYGGAVLNNGTAIEPSFSLKSSQMIEGKKIIGEAITHLIRNGDSIFFDCGTTVVQVVKNLPDLKITAITNSLPVCNILKAYPNIKLISIGGTYDEVSDGFMGTAVIKALSNFNIDKAIIGTQGFDIVKGATVPDENDASIKKAIIESAKIRILAVGHEKIGINYLSKFAEPSDFDYVVTDDASNAGILSDLKDGPLIVTDKSCTIRPHGTARFRFSKIANLSEL